MGDGPTATRRRASAQEAMSRELFFSARIATASHPRTMFRTLGHLGGPQPPTTPDGLCVRRLATVAGHSDGHAQRGLLPVPITSTSVEGRAEADDASVDEPTRTGRVDILIYRNGEIWAGVVRRDGHDDNDNDDKNSYLPSGVRGRPCCPAEPQHTAADGERAGGARRVDVLCSRVPARDLPPPTTNERRLERNQPTRRGTLADLRPHAKGNRDPSQISFLFADGPTPHRP